MRIFYLALLLLTLWSLPANADCTLTSNGETRPEGAVVYNQDHATLQGCIGGVWKQISKQATSVAVDDTPDPFDFIDQSGLNLSTLTLSEILQITGIDAPATVGIGGSGAEYRTCADNTCATVIANWTDVNGTIADGEYLQLRMPTSALYATEEVATVSVGSVDDDWGLETIPADTTPNAFSFTDQTGVAISTVTPSNIIQISGITGNVATSISGGSASYRTCSDAACASVLQNWTSGAATIQNNQYLQLRLTSSASYSTAVATTMTVGTGSDGWSVTTAADCTTGPIGTVCSDGAIYAGITPDGNVRMYVAPTNDSTSAKWAQANGTNTAMVDCTAPNGAQTSCATGEANTTLLYALGTTPSPAPYEAARVCRDKGASWYLPSIKELVVISANYTLFGSLSGMWFWSSSERNANVPYAWNFPTASFSGGQNKNEAWYVRCVRK